MDDLIDIRGKPRIYKNVKIYPIQMKNCINFYQVVSCLMIEKNKSKDISVIKMSYLDYLFKLFGLKDKNDEVKQIFYYFIQLLKLVFREQNFDFKINNKNKIEIFICKDKEKFNEFNELLSHFIINKNKINKQAELNKKIKQYENDSNNKIHIINGSDFNEIRKIILRQNRIKFDDDLLDPEVKKALEDARKFIEKKSAKITLEEEYVAYHCSIGLKYEDIDNLTIYQFTKGIEMKAHQVYYEMMGTALATGMIDMKGKMPTWIAHFEEQGQYDDVTISKKEFDKLASKTEIKA